MSQRLKIGSLFSGYGGLDMAVAAITHLISIGDTE